MMIWFHYDNGANPYGIILDHEKGYKLFTDMITAYNCEIIPNSEFVDGFSMQVHERINNKLSAYNDRKEAIRNFAIEYQYATGDMRQSWYGVSTWSDYFATMGKKYGLLREFRENAIC